MKNFIAFALVFSAATSAMAGVRMLGSSYSDGGTTASLSQVSFEASFDEDAYRADSTSKWCQDNGYDSQVCDGDVGIVVACPRNNSYLRCCPSGYRFRKEFCESQGYVPSDDHCMGYYRCYPPEPVVSEN